MRPRLHRFEQGDLRDTSDLASLELWLYCVRSQFATARGSNRTHVPTRNDGILPAAGCLKIVIGDTQLHSLGHERAR